MDSSVQRRLLVTIVTVLVACSTPAFAQDAGVDGGADASSSDAPDAGSLPVESDAGVSGTDDATDAGVETPASAPVVPTPPPEPPVARIPTAEAPPRVSEAATAIEVHVIDHATGEALIEATVIAEANGQRVRGYTDVDGNVTLEVTPGLWTVRAVTEYYREARHRPIRVRVGQRARMTMRLREGDTDSLVFEVVETADTRTDAVVNTARMNATTAQDTVSAQSMARTGSTTAARAVTRIVGASTEGSTVIVRGLADRYVSVLMNGVVLPGTDPDRNGVQLDVIPAALIANISVIKTFQPDVPGNWAGGLVMINSQTMPERFEFRVSGSLAANSQSTFRNNLDYPGARADWTGFGLRGRTPSGGVPSYYAQPYAARPGTSYVTPEEAQVAGQRYSRGWEYNRNRDYPNGTLQMSLGNSHDLGHGRRFGYLAGFTYSRTSQVRIGPNITLTAINENGDPQPAATFASESATDEVLFTAFATSALRYGSGDIRFLGMFTQNSTDETKHQAGDEADALLITDRWQLRYIQRSLLFVQLAGEQRQISWWTDEGARLNYSVYYSQGRRDEPLTRQIRYASRSDGGGGELSLIESPNGSDVQILDLDQRDYGGYAHFHAPLFDGGSMEVGSDVRLSDRTSYFRQIHFRVDQTQSADVLAAPANQILDPSLIVVGGPVTVDERPAPTNNYSGESVYAAAFATFNIEPADWFRVAGGVRFEHLDREVSIVAPVEGYPIPPGGTPSNVRRTSNDFLPAVTTIFSPSDAMNVRLAYGMTVVHPQFREFAPVSYYEFARRRMVSGDIDLVRTHIHNVDARWEWLHGTNGLFAVSLFYKKFLDPIERVAASVGSRDIKYSNAESGQNVGTELEARLSLGEFDDRNNALDWFSINANVALIYSRVQVSEADMAASISSSRAMYYQSPYVANLSLGFDHAASGVTLTLAYNVVGPRITEVGYRYGGLIGPNVVEQQFQQLDLIGGYKINDHWRMSLAARNLINPYREFRQGPAPVERYRHGIDVGIGIGFSN